MNPSHASLQDDLALLARWREGDGAAGNAIVQTHYRSVYSLIRTLVRGDSDLAEELTQRVFEVLLRKREEISENVGRYLKGIARNKVREHYRRQHAPSTDAIHELPMLGDGTMTLLMRRENRVLLVRALRSLTRPEQCLLLWVYVDGLTQQSIGERLGLSKQQVNGKIDRARHKLRRELERLAASRQQLEPVMPGFETWAHSLRARPEQ